MASKSGPGVTDELTYSTLLCDFVQIFFFFLVCYQFIHLHGSVFIELGASAASLVSRLAAPITDG